MLPKSSNAAFTDIRPSEFCLFRLLNQGILLCIRVYRYGISPFLPKSCRFYPSCSAYALEAYTRFGFFRGTKLTLFRLCKCHPFHPGGVDLLPDECSDPSHLNS